MPDDAPEPSRQFSDQEVRLILKAATELQQRTPATGEHPSRGLSLQELEEIAAEAGIAPEHIRSAAAAVEAKRRRRGGSGGGEAGKFLGAPTRLLLAREFPGEISDAAGERIVETIRRVTGDLGEVERLGRTLTWKVRRPASFLFVMVSPHDGRTTVRIEHKIGEVALSVYMGTLTGGGILGGVSYGVAFGLLSLAAPVALGAAAAVLGSSYLSGRKMYRSLAETRRQQMHDLMDHIAKVVG